MTADDSDLTPRPSAPTPSLALRDPEEPAGITRMRYENKLCVPAEQLAEVLRIVATHMPRVRGGAGTPAIGTFYFDDEAGSHLRAAIAEPVSLRLRLREYPTIDGRHEHWLEVKRNAGVTSDKRRRLLASAEVAVVLGDPDEAARLFRSIAPELATDALRPVLSVRYFRETFAEEGCRLTADREVSFFAPPSRLELPLAPHLSRPLRLEAEATVEIKRTAPERAWMKELRKRLTAQLESKFVRGARALSL